jgi:hypothetical protein
VAVKQLKARSGQGERQFQAEVNISSRVFRDEYSAKVGRVLLQRYELGEEVAPAAAAGSELEFFYILVFNHILINKLVKSFFLKSGRFESCLMQFIKQ